MNTIKIKANAKINIGLYVTSKRDDGFHNIETVFYPIYDLYDTLTIKKNVKTGFTSNNTQLKSDSSNLVIAALNELKKLTNKDLSVQIFLNKKIPIGAGLGGGSSDAAATLIGLNKLFALSIPNPELNKIALELGSDVPFFLLNKPAVGTSRGEILNEINLHIPQPILIVNPGVSISTKNAFKNITPVSTNINFQNLFNKITDFSLLKDEIKNVFETNIFEKYPAVKNIKEKMYRYNALFSLMSGTGSTVFGIFENQSDVIKCRDNFSEKYFKYISNI